MTRRWISALIILIISIALGASVRARAAEPEPAAGKNWSVEVKVKKFMDSHTSYEFGTNDQPNYAPLSRLEFPMNTWWVGAEARYRFPRFSAGLEVMKNLTRETHGVMKDSDWDDPNRPGVRTIYSESNCRMESSHIVRADLDMKVSDWVGLPQWIDIRPVVGFRWQRFSFMASDVTQWEAGQPELHITGDGLRFEQTYWHYFAGMRGDYQIGKHIGVRGLSLLGQVDYAWVKGKNEDQHLLRQGGRFTYENTTGHAWHALLGVKYKFAPAWTARLESEYLRINTSGSHRWVVRDFGIDESWENGVNVWSEQLSVSLGLEYAF